MVIWTPNKPKVNRRNCTCSCFDTNFRGKTIVVHLRCIEYFNKNIQVGVDRNQI